MKILVLQGPNLNLLGTRERSVYGEATLDDVQRDLDGLAEELGVELEHFQANGEGALIDRVQRAAAEGVGGAIVNAGAYTHTSVALRDALVGTALSFVEIHISNVHARESFRHQSLLSDVSCGVVFGFGVTGYRLALRGLVEQLSPNP